MNPRHPVIDKNINFIREHLETHTLYWIAKQIGISGPTLYRYAKRYGFKRLKGSTTAREWTPAMLTKLRSYFPVMFNGELAEQLGVSVRTLIRKARELGLGKDPGVINKKRGRIAHISRRPNGPEIIARLIEAGKPYRFTSKKRPKKKPDFAKIWETRRANAAAVQERLKKPY